MSGEDEITVRIAAWDRVCRECGHGDVIAGGPIIPSPEAISHASADACVSAVSYGWCHVLRLYWRLMPADAARTKH